MKNGEKIRSFTPYSFKTLIVLIVSMTVKYHGKQLMDMTQVLIAVIATTQIMLEAYDLEIESVWVREYDKRVLDELLDP